MMAGVMWSSAGGKADTQALPDASRLGNSAEDLAYPVDPGNLGVPDPRKPDPPP